MASIIAGLRFDVSVVCFWLFPVLISQLARRFLKNGQHPAWNKAENLYLRFGLFLFLLICISDIFYYKHYFSHINAAVLNWIESPGEVTGMLWGETTFRNSLLAMAVLAFGILFLHRFLYKKIDHNRNPKRFTLVAYLVLFALVFTGMRGGLRARPLNLKDANISEHFFFNQVAINPVYFLYHDLFEIEEPIYAYNLQTEQYATELGNTFIQPDTITYSPTSKPHIVFIIMESMAFWKLPQAPFLNSLSQKSIFFDSFYSSGEHTYNGIYSSLYGEPALMQKHMLRWMESSDNKGLPGFLKTQGYYNFFHIPHSRSFDNMGAFIWRHSFDTLVDKMNFPKQIKNASMWGMDDHYMMQYAINNMDFAVKKGKPVFNVILTISDHEPYHLPVDSGVPEFQGPIKSKVVQYADWSLQRFFSLAESKPWYKNTVFVLIGDHGSYNGSADYPLPLSLHHIPFLIFNPSAKNEAKIYHNLGAQPDVPTTLLSYLGYPTQQNPLSVNLLNSKRPFAFFCSDNYTGLLRQEGYYLLNQQGQSEYYHFTTLPASAEMQSQQQQILLNLSRYSALRIEKSRKK